MSTNNATVLTPHAATIQTAQVEIQVLRVGSKQVTMGMFRQIPLRLMLRWWDLIEWQQQGWWLDETMDGEESSPLMLRGTPWGHVNYWWTENDREKPEYLTERGTLIHDRGERLHLLWQEQGRLYRDIVYERVPLWVLDYEHPESGKPLFRHRRSQIICWWKTQWEQFTALPQLFIAV